MDTRMTNTAQALTVGTYVTLTYLWAGTYVTVSGTVTARYPLGIFDMVELDSTDLPIHAHLIRN